MKWLFLTLILSSCGSLVSSLVRDEQKNILAAWKGKPVSELESHPFFSKVPLKRKTVDGDVEVRNYEERGKYQSKARMQALGGGMGLPSETCQNIFTIKNGIIQKYEMKESCLTNEAKLP